MRLHLTEVIPERVELTNLQNEYATVMQQIADLQRENEDMVTRLKELEPANESAEEASVDLITE